MHRPSLCEPGDRRPPAAPPEPPLRWVLRGDAGTPTFPVTSTSRASSPYRPTPPLNDRSFLSDPSGGSMRRRETWVALVPDPSGLLWYDDGEGSHLCQPCGKKLDLAYDGSFQLSMRIRREQLVHGALQSAIQSLRSLCLGDVSLEEILGQHWAQMKLQYDIINILLEAQNGPGGPAQLQDIKHRLADFKRAYVERMDYYRACSPDVSWERLRAAVLHLQADNRRLLEDVEMLHAANTLLESDIQMLSAQLERYVKKASKAAARGEAEGSPSEPLQRELAESRAQRRRVEQERDVLELENQRLQQDVGEVQKRADELWSQLKKAEVELLTVTPRSRDELAAELARENDGLRATVNSLQAELVAMRADRNKGGDGRIEQEGTAAAARPAEELRALEAARQEASKAQMACIHLAEALTAKGHEVQALQRRLEEAVASGGPQDHGAADLLAAQRERDHAAQEGFELRARCLEKEGQVVQLQADLKAARRMADLHAEQLASTLEALAQKETLLAETQSALHQARRANRDQQGELRALLDELQVRRGRGSGRSTPARGPSPSPTPVRALRCASPVVLALLKADRGPGRPHSEASADGDGPRGSGSDCGTDGPLDEAREEPPPLRFTNRPLIGPPAPHVPSASRAPPTPLDTAENLRSTDGPPE